MTPAAEGAVAEPVSAATTAGVLTALLEVLVLGAFMPRVGRLATAAAAAAEGSVPRGAAKGESQNTVGTLHTGVRLMLAH